MLPVTKRAIPLGLCRAHAQPKDRWADGVKAVSRRRRWRAAPALRPAVHRSTKTQLLLAPLYGWFTEGFDTPDLKEAKVLMEELG